MHSGRPVRIGCCISPHGYGHASRALAVMQSLARAIKVRFEIVTSIPAWFFSQSLGDCFSIHDMVTDIGMVQSNPLEENLEATTRALDNFFPPADDLVNRVAEPFQACDLVLCDIAPLGILAARRAGVRSVLIENFTWDWIYEGYQIVCPKFAPHVKYLEEVFLQATFHVQAEPVCRPLTCDLRAAPVARSLQGGAAAIREQLQVGPGIKLILLTMGGIQGKGVFIDCLTDRDDCIFAVPGQRGAWQRQGNIWYLPALSGVYHPDLVAASDVVIGKVGYSTLAEVYQAGVPFGYIQRPRFRESKPLAEFIAREMPSSEIAIDALNGGNWGDNLSTLLALPRTRSRRPGGAKQISNFLLSLL